MHWIVAEAVKEAAKVGAGLRVVYEVEVEVEVEAEMAWVPHHRVRYLLDAVVLAAAGAVESHGVHLAVLVVRRSLFGRDVLERLGRGFDDRSVNPRYSRGAVVRADGRDRVSVVVRRLS
jgi:hypothetical protein